jgi:hypothetical protein
VKIVSQIDGDQDSCRRRVDRHVVSRVVQEFRSGVSLYIVRVVVAPSKLNINPIFLSGCVIHCISAKTFVNKNNLSTFVNYFVSASNDGLDTFHLYAENNKISAQEEFILYDFLG